MRSKLKIIIPIGIALIAIALAFVFIRFAPTKSTNIGTMISTAQQYLTEQKYEQAIAEFQKIIEIDPKNADAYIGMAKAYIGIGDTDKAVEVLEDGYEQTNDDRILEMLEELKSGEETLETTVTTVETTETETSETTAEVTETEITETTMEVTETSITETEITMNAESKRIKQQALDILSPYSPNKSKGEPNSTFYAYTDMEVFGDSNTYNCFKCEYDEKGNLKNEYFIQIDEGKICRGDIIIGTNPIKSFSVLNNGNFVVGEGSGRLFDGAMWGTFYNILSESKLIQLSENKYELDKVSNVYIYTENGEVTKIETGDNAGNYSLYYDQESSIWRANIMSTPYKIGLPDGYDDSIFELDESKIEKTFTDYNEYHDYINNN